MCSYINRVLAVTKNIVLLQDQQLQKLLQALLPKYAVTNSSCYKLLLFAITNRNFDTSFHAELSSHFHPYYVAAGICCVL